MIFNTEAMHIHLVTVLTLGLCCYLAKLAEYEIYIFVKNYDLFHHLHFIFILLESTTYIGHGDCIWLKKKYRLKQSGVYPGE